MKPLQVAVVGAGHLGRIHAKLLGQVDGAKLVAIIDPIAEARAAAENQYQVPTFATCDEALGLLDAAIVASPTVCHADTVNRLLSAGKHVFVEKPITTSVQDAELLVQLAHKQRRVLQVGHVERFNPAWVAASEVTQGAKYVEAVRASRFPGRCLDVGVVLDLMIHDLDLVLSLTDAPVKSVSASGLAVVTDHEDMAEARVEFACGLIANFKASRISLTPARQMKTFGPAGFSEIDFGSLSLTTVAPETTLVDRSFNLAAATSQPLKFADQLFSSFLVPQTVQVDARNALLDELHDFVISIQSRSLPTVSGYDGLRAVALAEQILDSIRERCWSGDRESTLVGPHATPSEDITSVSRRVHAARKAA